VKITAGTRTADTRTAGIKEGPVNTRTKHARRGGIIVLLTLLLTLGTLGLGTRTLLAQTSGPVFALPGTLRQVFNRTYDTALVIADGREFGLVGETPALEQEIVALRANGPEFAVKVWGEYYDPIIDGNLPVIVVSGILPVIPAQPTATPTATVTPTATATLTPTATPSPTPTPDVPMAVVLPAAVNVRSGPSTDYPPITTATQGTTCTVIGRNQASTWWMLSCPGGSSGWVLGTLLRLSGPLDQVRVIPVAPPPTPVPPATYANWKSSFYANRDLAGDPARVQDLPNLSFNWGGGSPGGGVPEDDFSARFERTLELSNGLYELSVTVDDGVRVFINDQLVINDWQVGSARTRVARQMLNGATRLRVEYFEATGNAQIQFSINLVGSGSVWSASYFNNPDLLGSAVVARGEPTAATAPMDSVWGLGSPANGIPANRWSARWIGDFYFEQGDYRFTSNVDDGIRVYIDGIRILDMWQPGYHADVTNTFLNIGAGNHQIVVEYFDDTNAALIYLRWDRITGGGGGRLRD
jgi:hypothetical protein